MGLIKLLKQLVEIPSPSGKEDEIAIFLSDYINNLGFKTKIEDSNLIINSKSDFFVTTHIDTVGTKKPFSFDGKFAHGTGVCDAKGSIAAILISLERIDELNYGIVFFSDEEEGGEGSKIFSGKHKPKMAVVMEPTSLAIAKRQYGSLEVELEIKGEKAHGSMPEFGINAIEKTIEFFESLKSLKTKFPPIKFSILKIEGGSDEYVIPDRCKVKLDFVYPPEVSVSQLKNKILNISKYYGSVEIIEECGGFEGVKVVELLERAIKMAKLGVRYSEMPSWTDAINLKLSNCDVAVWGPGELRYCHTEMERIDVNEILKASDVLVRLNELV